MIDRLCWRLIQLGERADHWARRRRLVKSLGQVGRDFSFHPGSVFVTPETVRVGESVFLGMDAHLSGVITIGDCCMFGPGLTLLAGDHYFGVKGHSVRILKPRGHEKDAPIIIEREVWAGARVTVLGGVTIGMGAVVGAGSVVVCDLPPYVVAVGNPCRSIKRIFSDDVLREHLQILGLSVSEADQITARRSKGVIGTAAERSPVVDQTVAFLSIWDSTSREDFRTPA